MVEYNDKIKTALMDGFVNLGCAVCAVLEPNYGKLVTIYKNYVIILMIISTIKGIFYDTAFLFFQTWTNQ